MNQALCAWSFRQNTLSVCIAMVFCVIRYFYQQKEPISEDNLSMQKESVLCLKDHEGELGIGLWPQMHAHMCSV